MWSWEPWSQVTGKENQVLLVGLVPLGQEFLKKKKKKKKNYQASFY